MYGFHKVDDPTGTNNKHFEFKNVNFVPGKRDLLKKIERRKAVKRATRNEDEPSSKQAFTTMARKSSVSSVPMGMGMGRENKPDPLHHQIPADILLFYVTLHSDGYLLI